MRSTLARSSPVLLLAAALLAPACGSPSSGSGAPGASASAALPKGPPIEKILFPSGRSVLADLPAMKLIPKTAPVVLAARDPAGAVAKLSALGGFSDAKEPLAKEIDAAAKDFSKDLPELAALAQNGVDLSKPAGVVWMDHDLDTTAIFASVSDEARMMRWLEERAKQSNGKREIATVEGALVLRAKRDVTRAVVLRKGHVFFLRARDLFSQAREGEADRVTRAAEALAKTPEGDSVAADPTFTKAMETLAFGSQATLYVNATRFAEGLVAARGRAVEAARKQLDEAKAALADAEAKKRKGALEEAKTAVTTAERTQRHADEAAKKVEVLGLLKDEVPSITAGVEIGDREVKLEAFVAIAKPGGPKVLAPIGPPSAVFDASLGAHAAGQFAIDPRLFDFAIDLLGKRSIAWRILPLEAARAELGRLGVDRKELDPLLDGEVSAAAHPQKVAVPPAEDAGTGTGTAAPGTRERDGFTVIWHVSDPARVTAILEAAWKVAEPTERAAKGQVKRLAPGSYELARSPGDTVTRLLLAGSSLVVTTQDAPADLVDPARLHPTWMAGSDHPFSKQLAGIEGASGLVAFESGLWGSRGSAGLWGDRLDLDAFGKMGGLGVLGMGTGKSKKLLEQRDKLDKQVRELEMALEQHKDATWKSFAPRLGSTAFYAKPADGGVAVYGGLSTPEASVSALAEAAIAAWLSVGPKWEKWGELTELRKKIHDIDDLIDADREKAMSDLVGSVLGGLGASDSGALAGFGRRGGSMFDDDVGTLLGDKPGLSSLSGGDVRQGGTSAPTNAPGHGPPHGPVKKKP